MVLCALALLTSFLGHQAPTLSTTTGNNSALSLHLSVERKKWKAGDPIVVTAAVQNRGKEPALLLHWGWRWSTPRVQGEVFDAATNLPIPHEPLAGCGNTNGITADAFVPIASGATATLKIGFAFYGYTLVSGKRYRLVLHYKNDPNVEVNRTQRGSGLWSDDPTLMDKLKTTTACDITSNTVEIKVE